MNAEEPLLQLDFDETNHKHYQHHQTKPFISELTEYQLQQRPSASSPSFLLSTSIIEHTTPRNTSAPILSTESNVTLVDPATDVFNYTHQHHRRAFSDDNSLASMTQTFHPHQSHSNQYLNDTNTKHLLGTNSLISLSHSSGELNTSGDENSIGNLTTAEIQASELSSNQLVHHTDDHDTVEINLLGDTSMDSRESQPLLGVGRDTHDFIYNNFPGECCSLFNMQVHPV